MTRFVLIRWYLVLVGFVFSFFNVYIFIFVEKGEGVSLRCRPLRTPPDMRRGMLKVQYTIVTWNVHFHIMLS